MIKRITTLAIITLLLVLAAGCTPKVRYSPGELDVFTPEVREHIVKKEISLGMTQAAVRYSWGAPQAVKVIPEGDKEIWVYSSARVYVTKLTFAEGKLVGSTSGFSLNSPISRPGEQNDKNQAAPPAEQPTPADTAPADTEIKIEE